MPLARTLVTNYWADEPNADKCTNTVYHTIDDSGSIPPPTGAIHCQQVLDAFTGMRLGIQAGKSTARALLRLGPTTWQTQLPVLKRLSRHIHLVSSHKVKMLRQSFHLSCLTMQAATS